MFRLTSLLRVRSFSTSSSADSIKHFLSSCNQAQYADKFTSWGHLLSCRSADLKKLELPIKARKRLLAHLEVYRQRVKLSRMQAIVDEAQPGESPADVQEKLYSVYFEEVYDRAAFKQEKKDLEMEWRLRGEKRRQMQRDRGNELFSLWEEPATPLPDDGNVTSEELAKWDKSPRFLWKEVNDPRQLLEHEIVMEDDIRENQALEQEVTKEVIKEESERIKHWDMEEFLMSSGSFDSDMTRGDAEAAEGEETQAQEEAAEEGTETDNNNKNTDSNNKL